MNVFSSTVVLLLALLSGINTSLLFLAHPRRSRLFAGNVNAANVGGGGRGWSSSLSSSLSLSSLVRSKSRLLYRGDHDDGNHRPPRVDDDGGGASALGGARLTTPPSPWRS
jgi:hypothetical protein